MFTKIATLATLATVALIATGAAANTYGPQNATTALEARVQAVCDNPAVQLSTGARAACITRAFPPLSGSGDAFANRGVGREFNVLIKTTSAASIGK
jgi:hypothetical protein